MKIQRAYKTELDPNNEQRGAFNRYAGTARFVYNWALADRKAMYEAGTPTNVYEQKRRFNALKHDQFPWIDEIAYVVSEAAFRHLDAAYQNFFRRVKKGETPGFPKFKNKYKNKSFTLRGSLHVETGRVKLPCIGWVKLKEHGYLPTDGMVKLNFFTISEKAGRWYISAQVEQEIPDPQPPQGETLGVDVGIKSLAVCSNGLVFENPKAMAQQEKKLKRLQRELARRQKGGSNRKKTQAKLSKCYEKINAIRKHSLHNASRQIVDAAPVVVLEDLNVAGMVRNHCLARAISDASFSELHRQITYKAGWNGVEIVTADRFYPSSKTCSACGYVKAEQGLSERVFICENCGTVIDRDLNAACNLAALAKGETRPDCLGS